MAIESFIKGVDFVYVYATDIAEAERFYGEVLGPPISARYGKMPSVEFTGETIDSGVCHMAFFKDPSGNELLLHKRYAPQT